MPLSIEDQVEITNLLNRLTFAVDDRDVDAWVACFTPDGSFHSPNGVWKGEKEQRKLLAGEDGLPRRQHTITNLQIEGDGDRASARANGPVFEEMDGRYYVMNFSGQEHHLRRVDGTWLIERTIRHRPKRTEG